MPIYVWMDIYRCIMNEKERNNFQSSFPIQLSTPQQQSVQKVNVSDGRGISNL